MLGVKSGAPQSLPRAVCCVAETLPTVEPIVSSPGTGGVYSPGTDPQNEPNIACIDFRIPDAEERARLAPHCRTDSAMGS